MLPELAQLQNQTQGNLWQQQGYGNTTVPHGQKGSGWDALAMLSPASWLFKGGRKAAGRGFSNLWSGTPGQTHMLPTQTPMGMTLLNQLMAGAGQNTNFGGIENMARKQFSENTIPSLAERFSTLGAQRSSEFRGALGQAGSDLESQLAGLRSQYGLQQARLGLIPQFENINETGRGGLNSQLGQMLPMLAMMGIRGGF